MELISRTADRINFHFRDARERRLSTICFAWKRAKFPVSVSRLLCASQQNEFPMSVTKNTYAGRIATRSAVILVIVVEI